MNYIFLFSFISPHETIYHHFYNVLQSIIELKEKNLIQPNDSQIPLEISATIDSIHISS